MGQLAADTDHLFRRAGFGGRADEVAAYEGLAWSELVEMVLGTDRAPAPPPLPDVTDGSEGHHRTYRMLHYWLDQARRPVDQAPIVEKVTLFWTGVLTSSVVKTFDHTGILAQNHLFRTLGMGSYRTLLHQVSLNTAMIRYLDNHHNVAGALNENFARELLELFTLGPGNYTEADVANVTRAWTGHGLDDGLPRGYRFDPGAHDAGLKTILGVTEAFDGPDVIDLILDRRRNAHARFMCHKLWSFFAYPVDADDQEVSDIMVTYGSDLNIRDTIRSIFLHPRFRSARARWALVRSPIEYLVAVMRHTGTDCSTLRPEWWCGKMGQSPFVPPKVKGWGANRYWLTSSSALARQQMLNYLHQETARRGDLSTVAETIATNPRTYRYTAGEAVELALENYQIGDVSSSSRQWLTDYVASVRSSEQRWTQRAGLLYLPLLVPELLMA